MGGYEAYLGAVNALEADMRARTDGELTALTDVFRRRLGDGESLDDLLAEGFAAVREAARRTLLQRHYDAQVMAGLAVHFGNIAEMPAGEGKTLAVTLPAYLNALAGGGVHVVTANDHLARRDADRLGVIYRFLGLDTGVIVPDMTAGQRLGAYQACVVYGAAPELGYDYLRDNLAWSLTECVQRDLSFAIVDDSDSVLLDLATTPLVISGPGPVTLATITVGSFLRLYDKLGGLTAATGSEAASYHEMYGLEVIEIPARRPVIRLDRPDLIYRTRQARTAAILGYRFAAVDDAHRLLVYAQRRGVLERTRLQENVQEMIDEVTTSSARADAHAAYSRREQQLTPDVMRELEQQVLLNVIDRKWGEHLTRTSALKDKIWRSDLDSAAQLAEYLRQSRELLDRMITDVKQEAVSYLFNLDVEVSQPAQDPNDLRGQ